MSVTPLLLMLAVPVVLMTVAALVALVALVGRQVWRVLLVLLFVVAVGLLAVVGGAKSLRRPRTVTIVAPQAAERPEQEIARQIAELQRRVDELRRQRDQLRSQTAAEPSRLTPREDAAAEFVVHRPMVVGRDGARPLLEADHQSERNEPTSAGDAKTPISTVEAGQVVTDGAPEITAEVVSDQQLEDVQLEDSAVRETSPLALRVGSTPDQAASLPDHADRPRARPTWVGSPRHWEGPVHTTSLAIGPYSTLDECQRLVKREAEKAIAQYDDWYLGQRGGSHRMLIRPAKYPEDWTESKNCYHETSQSRLLGETMHTLHVLLRFPEPYRRQLDACWQQTVAASRLLRVALLSGAVLALLAMVYLYLRLDLATKGCYTRRLQCALAGTILVLAAAGLLLTRWLPWI